MKTAIILHGMPSKEAYFNPAYPSQSNKHWIPWLQKSLIINNILTQTPELPEPYSPDYEKWCSIFEQFKIDENTLLIGPSCSAGFLIRWLSENKVKVEAVALVAPFLNPNNTIEMGKFFDFTIDKELSNRIGRTCVFYSTDDNDYILKTVEIIKTELADIEVFEFDNKGHFTFGDMKTEEFPELLEWLLN